MYSSMRHGTDVVLSQANGFIFLDNVKGWIIHRLDRHFGRRSRVDRTKPMGPFHLLPNHSNKTKNPRMSRPTTTECVLKDEAKDLFVWSVARDPVEKLQSGVRQAWLFSHGSYSYLSADDLLSKQLLMPIGSVGERALASHHLSNDRPVQRRSGDSNTNCGRAQILKGRLRTFIVTRGMNDIPYPKRAPAVDASPSNISTCYRFTSCPNKLGNHRSSPPFVSTGGRFKAL
eukprot:FR736594.1.p1 GENE.FR736594.1~~FR736594.1.p1  ORF type:complete len:230 (+),score=2.02 FR736594.1:180-869(+)